MILKRYIRSCVVIFGYLLSQEQTKCAYIYIYILINFLTYRSLALLVSFLWRNQVHDTRIHIHTHDTRIRV
jgi:hypothetical protein